MKLKKWKKKDEKYKDRKAVLKVSISKKWLEIIRKIKLNRMETGIKRTSTSRTKVKKDEMVVSKPIVIKNGNVVLNDYFMVNVGVYKIMERNIKTATNTLLLGPTGVGKTEMVKNIADRMGLPLTIFDMGTMTDPIMSLVGTHIIKVKDGTTSSEFAKSRFSDVIQQPGIVLLDELSRASAAANNLLFPCLDFRRELSMEYCFEDCTPIKVHSECVFIATANLGSQYTGTHKLDRALIDRFMMIEIDPLKADNIKQILKVHVPSLKDEDIEKIVTCYTKINASHDSYTISFNLSIRHLKMVAELVRDGFTIYDSFFTICKGIGGKDGLKALADILNNTKMK